MNATVDDAGVPAEMDADDDVSISPTADRRQRRQRHLPHRQRQRRRRQRRRRFRRVSATTAVETGDFDEDAEVGHREHSDAMAKAVQSSPMKPERAVQQPAKVPLLRRSSKPAKGCRCSEGPATGEGCRPGSGEDRRSGARRRAEDRAAAGPSSSSSSSPARRKATPTTTWTTSAPSSTPSRRC